MSSAFPQHIRSAASPPSIPPIHNNMSTSVLGPHPASSSHVQHHYPSTRAGHGSGNGDYQEIKSVCLEWKLDNLKHIFDSSRGETKSKCIKSSLFGDGRWEVYFYANSGTDHVSLYLSAEPTPEEKERGLRAAAKKASNNSLVNTGILPSSASSSSLGSAASKLPHQSTQQPHTPAAASHANTTPWTREGSYRFVFEIRPVTASGASASTSSVAPQRPSYGPVTPNGSMGAIKLMEATDHSFSEQARNWGWQNFMKRSEAYYNNVAIKAANAFLIVCTITYSPTPPTTHSPLYTLQHDGHWMSRRLVPVDLLNAFSSMFNDPRYSDVRFVVRSRSARTGKRRERVLYAIKRILAARSEYFATMFNSGFSEGDSVPLASARTNSDTVSSHGHSKSKFRERGRQDDSSMEEEEGTDDSSVDSDEDLLLNDGETDSHAEEDGEDALSDDDDVFEEQEGDEDEEANDEMQGSIFLDTLDKTSKTENDSRPEGEHDHDEEEEDDDDLGGETTAHTSIALDETALQTAAMEGLGGQVSSADALQPLNMQTRPSSETTHEREEVAISLDEDHSASQVVPPQTRLPDAAAPAHPRTSTMRSVSTAMPNGQSVPLPTSAGQETKRPGNRRKKPKAVRADEVESTDTRQGRGHRGEEREMTTVIITDTSYATYKALLYFLYTDNICFAPLSSTYNVARDTAEALGRTFPFDGRKHFFDFEARSSPYQLYSAGIPIKGPDGAPDTIPAASAKSMYKLADKINMKELKVKSLNFLINNLNLVNLPYEVFSNFSMSFAEVKKVEIEMMLAHWSEIRHGQAMKNVFRLIRQDPDRFPAFEEVWEYLIEHLEYRTPVISNAAGGAALESKEA